MMHSQLIKNVVLFLCLSAIHLSSLASSKSISPFSASSICTRILDLSQKLEPFEGHVDPSPDDIHVVIVNLGIEKSLIFGPIRDELESASMGANGKELWQGVRRRILALPIDFPEISVFKNLVYFADADPKLSELLEMTLGDLTPSDKRTILSLTKKPVLRLFDNRIQLIFKKGIGEYFKDMVTNHHARNYFRYRTLMWESKNPSEILKYFNYWSVLSKTQNEWTSREVERQLNSIDKGILNITSQLLSSQNTFQRNFGDDVLNSLVRLTDYSRSSIYLTNSVVNGRLLISVRKSRSELENQFDASHAPSLRLFSNQLKEIENIILAKYARAPLDDRDVLNGIAKQRLRLKLGIQAQTQN